MSKHHVMYWIDDVMHESSEDRFYEHAELIVTPRSNDLPNMILNNMGRICYYYQKDGLEHRDNQKPSFIRYHNNKVERIDFNYKGLYHRDYGKPCHYDSEYPIHHLQNKKFRLYGFDYDVESDTYIEYSEYRDYLNTIKEQELFDNCILNMNSNNKYISMLCKDKLGLL